MTPQQAFEELQSLNKKLAARSKKLKDKDGEAISKKVAGAIKTFESVFASDAKVAAARASLATAINVHNGQLGKAAGELKKLEADVAKLVPNEPNPRIYVTLHPVIVNVRNLPAQPLL